MPRINIYEQDNTGSSPVADLAVVFVPGEIAIKEGKEDANHCIYIPSTATDLGEYFEDAKFSYSKNDEIDVRHLIKTLIGLNYGVVYMDVTDVNAKDWVYSITQVTSETFNPKTTSYYILRNGSYIEVAEDATYDANESYFTRVESEYTKWNALTKTSNGWDFLNDKNAYDIKFITTGTHYTVPVIPAKIITNKNTKDNPDFKDYKSNQKVENYGFNFELANRALTIPTSRKDCALLIDLDYTPSDIKANELAKDFKTALECTVENSLKYMLNKVQTNDDLSQTCVSSRAYTLFSNALMEYSSAAGNFTLTVPGSLVYLYAYATVNNVATSWLPISGVTRGVVGEVFTPDIELSKYFLDTQIISDDAGVSFNGLVNIRSYGYTIWGDRTLLEQDAVKKVQATSYFSLRNLVSDIAKTAYNSAIRYTYETNNDVTWLNFKQAIITLLDQMVSSGVLQTYKVNRKPSSDTERNKMIAIIKIYPVLPVENFDVYINLENAELTTTADDIQA